MKLGVIERVTCSYENTSDRFILGTKKKFDLQYSQLYAVRLMAMRMNIEKAAQTKWGPGVKVKQLSDINQEEKCVIIGTLFRKMELQPSILKEISQEEAVLPVPLSEKYVSETDELILEDQQQRIILTGNISLPTSVTGTILAVYGSEVNGGRFHVQEYCHYLLPQQPPVSLNQSLHSGQDRYILFLSGLGIGSCKDNPLSLQLLIDLITGRLSSEEDQMKFSNICRVIIAGNSLSRDTQDKDTEKVAKYLSRNTQAKSVSAMKSLDKLLVQLGSCVPVDIMPGEFDPSNQFLPQQPLHRCMLPNAFSLSTVQSVTNPYEATVGGLRVLGTAGQNVSNIYQYSGFEQRLDILESTLKFGHLSPTSPDTLSCYPYHSNDPFILENCPHIYFAGNQPTFEAREMKGKDGQSVLLLTIPMFEVSNTAILVNLRDCSCYPLIMDPSIP